MSILVRGIRKTQKWEGWTDGISFFVGVDMPYTVQNYEITSPVTAEQIQQLWEESWVEYDNTHPASLVRVPLLAAVKTEEVVGYTPLDYWDIYHLGGIGAEIRWDPENNRAPLFCEVSQRYLGFFQILTDLDLDKEWVF